MRSEMGRGGRVAQVAQEIRSRRSTEIWRWSALSGGSSSINQAEIGEAVGELALGVMGAAGLAMAMAYCRGPSRIQRLALIVSAAWREARASLDSARASHRKYRASRRKQSGRLARGRRGVGAKLHHREIENQAIKLKIGHRRGYRGSNAN